MLTATFFLTACILMAAGQQTSDSKLLETGGPAKPERAGETAKEVSVVTYNIRWRTGPELKQIAEWLKAKQPTVIALQEVDRARERTNKTNNGRVLAEELGMYYAWAAPPLPAKSKEKEEETGVALLSPYALKDVTRLVLPHEGPGGRWRVALGATIKFGKTEMRVYSVHAETRIPIDQKIEQFRAVLDDLKRFPKTMPAIVMGDFNSWEPATASRVRKLFTEADFTTPFDDKESTFSRSAVFFDVKLKLDWMWLRRLTPSESGIDRTITVSDHYPLWASTAVQPEAREANSKPRPVPD